MIPKELPKIGSADEAANTVLNAIRHPVIMVNEEGFISFANWEAEVFFGASGSHLARRKIDSYIPFGSPLLETGWLISMLLRSPNNPVLWSSCFRNAPWLTRSIGN